jgi:CheY-like chemotaxis protein
MPPPLLLLVDDAQEISFLVGRLARQAGHTLIACRDAPEALQWLATTRPDLAIVDVNLPGMSGLELCTRMRALPGLEEKPIALFAHPQRTDDIAAGLEAGADFLLSKDLLAKADAWHARLGEILEACRDREKKAQLQWCDSPLSQSLPEDGIGALNEALRHPAVLQLGPAVLRILLRRVLQRLARAIPPTEGQPKDAANHEVGSWLLPDGMGLGPSAFPFANRARWAALCAVALADQVGVLWGNAAGKTARAALLAVAAPNGASA